MPIREGGVCWCVLHVSVCRGRKREGAADVRKGGCVHERGERPWGGDDGCAFKCRAWGNPAHGMRKGAQHATQAGNRVARTWVSSGKVGATHGRGCGGAEGAGGVGGWGGGKKSRTFKSQCTNPFSCTNLIPDTMPDAIAQRCFTITESVMPRVRSTQRDRVPVVCTRQQKGTAGVQGSKMPAQAERPTKSTAAGNRQRGGGYGEPG